jgi:hypothetical protein
MCCDQDKCYHFWCQAHNDIEYIQDDLTMMLPQSGDSFQRTADWRLFF